MVTQTKTTNCTAAYTWYIRVHQIDSFVRRRGLKSRHGSKFSTTLRHSRKIVSIEIDYPGSNNRTEFTFDCIGRKSKIVEVVSGSVTSTKQFVGGAEERDGSGSIVSQFFAAGQPSGSGLGLILSPSRSCTSITYSEANVDICGFHQLTLQIITRHSRVANLSGMSDVWWLSL
jgi:hypothetical protein